MKKFHFFLVAAIAMIGSAACTKVDPVSQDTLISFQVAKYTAQTKAGETSLIDEGYTTFQTSAWYYTAEGATSQSFMTKEAIGWNTTVANQWAPTARNYYWPKTGYINFYSIAGTKNDNATIVEDQVTFDLTSAAVAVNDNIMVADAAYKQTENSTEYKLDNPTDGEGVPTLFRHMLSQVYFDVKFDATSETDTKYNWSASISEAYVTVKDKGTLEVNFTPSSPVAKETKQGAITWTPSGDAVADKVIKGTAAVVAAANGNAVTTPAVELIPFKSVMPQTLTGLQIHIVYELTTTYDGANPIVETITLDKELTAVAPTITTWNPNTKYLYHITIKPEGKIYFDPAVEPWAEITNDEIELPKDI